MHTVCCLYTSLILSRVVIALSHSELRASTLLNSKAPTFWRPIRKAGFMIAVWVPSTSVLLRVMGVFFFSSTLLLQMLQPHKGLTLPLSSKSASKVPRL